MLKGQAKIDYMREYMRRRRSNTGLTKRSNKTVGLTDRSNKIEKQSFNPMMVGYVPPEQL
jgi:hypothetical protein